VELFKGSFNNFCVFRDPVDLPPEFLVRQYSLKESFSVEVATLCLSLADYPSGNGWLVHEADVFDSSKFTDSLRSASVVLCNPPFRDFSAAERLANDRIEMPRRPAELMRRVLETLPSDGLLGFVLPRAFLDGAGYRDIRGALARRYQDLSIVALPDRVFFESNVETAVLLCKEPANGTTTKVSFIHIREKDRARFLREFAYPVVDRERKTPKEASRNLTVITLTEIWDYLYGHITIGDIAEVHRGIEYLATKNRDIFAEKYLRPITANSGVEPGFVRGFHSAEGLRAFRTPTPVLLSVKKENLRGGAIEYSWDKPKVVMSASRVSRDLWCVAAFADEKGLVCYQNFTALWPSGDWTIKSLAAVLNGPLAAAFVGLREDNIHIRIRDILKRIPLPKLDKGDILLLDSLVDQYVELRGGDHASQEKSLLLKIDAFVLDGYGLSPRLERVLLDYFRGYARPVDCDFGDYYPEDVESFIPLSLYISEYYSRSTAEDFIRNTPDITEPLLHEMLSEME